MHAARRRPRLTLPIAPAAALAAAALVALGVILLPAELIEKLVLKSGIAALVPHAAPPLGFTARVVIALIAGGGVALFLFAGLWLLIGWRDLPLARRRWSLSPRVRRADRHPDAPPRRPVFAGADLGTPFLEVRAGDLAVDPAPLPVDWDQPLTTFERRRATVPAAQPNARFGPGERIEVFPLIPLATPTAATGAEESRPLPSATLHDLLARLEEGVQRREARRVPPAAPIEDTLGALRKLAARVG